MCPQRNIAIAIGNRADEYRALEAPTDADMRQLGIDMIRLGMEMRVAIAAEF